MGQVALVVGEALIDVVHRGDGSVAEHPGGSAANVAVALARLDRATLFHTCFAADRYGRMLSVHLDAAGVRLAGDPGSVLRSSSAVATLGDDGAATYEFDIDWRPGPLVLPDDEEPVVVHTSSYAAALPPGADEVYAAVDSVRSRATVSYDINARPAVTGLDAEVRRRVERLVGISDVVKASDEDLEALYPERSVDDTAAFLLGLGPAVVVVTRGSEGASWVAATGPGTVPAIAVTVADTIGAGDTFGAALVDALWSRGLLGAEQRPALRRLTDTDWAELLGLAARAAAVTVSRPGADPPHRHELP
ncbi:MAG: PfkB family carbohydrate kinase [Nocardioides sp.]|uniref:PfkB family carbohydrate kinase n=1 Tax=Nocardioides sp. TaxID=35761 RepID=UPI0039E59077